MFDNFPRMFSTDDTDGEEEPDDETGLDDLDDLEGVGGPTEEDESDDGGPDTEDLDVRLSELEEDIDTTESSLRSLRSSQEEMAASVEEMNDTIRRLAGMYDRIAAQQNPFVDGDDPGEVVGEPAEDGDDPAGDGEGVVSFDDLREGADGEDEHGDHEGDADGTTHEGRHERAPEPDHDEPDHREPPAAGETTPAPPDAGAGDLPVDRPTPLLSSVPEGYAGDVLVMEWLAMLMDESGPAGALRAVEYYEDVGWISGETRDHLVNVIGGPALDVFVDPTRPREPTAEEHVESHGYLRVISQLREL